MVDKVLEQLVGVLGQDDQPSGLDNVSNVVDQLLSAGRKSRDINGGGLLGGEKRSVDLSVGGERSISEGLDDLGDKEKKILVRRDENQDGKRRETYSVELHLSINVGLLVVSDGGSGDGIGARVVGDLLDGLGDGHG